MRLNITDNKFYLNLNIFIILLEIYQVSKNLSKIIILSIYQYFYFILIILI